MSNLATLRIKRENEEEIFQAIQRGDFFYVPPTYTMAKPLPPLTKEERKVWDKIVIENYERKQ
jgi:HEPN domain-containing protein